MLRPLVASPFFLRFPVDSIRTSPVVRVYHRGHTLADALECNASIINNVETEYSPLLSGHPHY